MAQKKFQDLNLNNAFLFAAALEDPETCRTILELILNRPVPEVTVHSEHSILYSSDFRYIRLDIYAKGNSSAAPFAKSRLRRSPPLRSSFCSWNGAPSA